MDFNELKMWYNSYKQNYEPIPAYVKGQKEGWYNQCKYGYNGNTMDNWYEWLNTEHGHYIQTTESLRYTLEQYLKYDVFTLKEWEEMCPHIYAFDFNNEFNKVMKQHIKELKILKETKLSNGYYLICSQLDSFANNYFMFTSGGRPVGKTAYNTILRIATEFVEKYKEFASKKLIIDTFSNRLLNIFEGLYREVRL